jgi:hypothetical protein
MNPVTYKAVAGIAGTAVALGAAGVAGTAIWKETHREAGDDPVLTKPRFAAFMIGSAAVTGGFVLADKLGGLNKLANVMGSSSANPLVKLGAAALSGAVMGAAVASIPGALLATGWGWVALAAPSD